ncbi:MAG: AsmA family protein, partial [Chromatiales bacterium]
MLALLAGGFIVVLKTSDLSQYRVPLQNFVAAETGRTLHINGDFEPVVSLTPAVRATNVHFANAAWADSDEMARIDEIYLQIQLWSLV